MTSSIGCGIRLLPWRPWRRLRGTVRDGLAAELRAGSLRYGILSHLEMQHVTLVGMAGDELLVELDAEARLRRRDHIARLPADRLAQDVGVEALPALDAFEDQEVGAAGRELDVGRSDHGAAIEVGRELHVLYLRERCDLLGLEKP